MSPSTGEPATSPRAEAWLAAGLAGLALAVLIGRVLWPDLKWSVWSDRDMTRALELWQHPQTSGAELNAGLGARIPGGAQYVLMNVLGLGADDPLRYQRGVHLADLAGALLLALAAHRLAGRWAAALVLALHASSPAVTETLREVWNPALTPPLACASVAALIAALAHQRQGAIVAWCGLCALGAQVHLSWLPWTVVGTALLVVGGPPGRARSLAAGAGLAVLLYSPFLLSELRSGATQLALLDAQRFARGVGGDAGWLPAPAATGRVLTWLASGLREPGVGVQLDVRSGLTLVGLVVAVGSGLALRTARARAAAGVGVGAVLVVALLVGDPSLPFFVRYFVVAEPALSLSAAVGLGTLASLVQARAPVVATLTQLVLTCGIAAVVWPHTAVWTEPREDDLRVLQAELAAVEAVTGWPPVEQAGRVVRVSRLADEPPWRAFDGIDYLLRRRGDAFPGSRTPPCAVWLREPVAAENLARTLARVLATEPAPVSVRDVHALPSGATLVVYDGVSRCPTSLVDRYLEDPEFAAISQTALHPAPVGQVTATALPDGVRWYVNLPLPGRDVDDADVTRVHLFVDVLTTATGTVATLRSEQLRGETHLRAWLATGLLHAPTLRVQRAEGPPVDVPFSTGFVGAGAASTPLTVALPDGIDGARVSLRTEVHPRREHGHPPPQPGRGEPMEVVLQATPP